MFSRSPLSAAVVAALAVLGAAGCDLGAVDPVSLQLTFQPDHTLNADGTCTVQYVAVASGFGSAQWDRVTILRNGNAVEDFVGAETAAFWGASSIRAGQAQESTAFIAPNGGANTVVEVHYEITGPRRTPLNVVCPDG